jgi:hypothetical protein
MSAFSFLQPQRHRGTISRSQTSEVRNKKQKSGISFQQSAIKKAVAKKQ